MVRETLPPLLTSEAGGNGKMNRFLSGGKGGVEVFTESLLLLAGGISFSAPP